MNKPLYTLPFGYLSISQVRAYQRCGRWYYYQYILKIRQSWSGSLLLGRAFHRGQEAALRAKLQDGEILETADVMDAFATNWDATLEDAKDLIEFKEGEDPGKLKDDGIKLSQLYYDELGKKLQPFLIEEEINVEIEGIPMKFRLDLVEDDYSIRDFKTAGQTPSDKEKSNKIHSSIQLVGYALGFREKYGERETVVGLDTVVNLKKEKKVIRQEVQISDARIARFTHTLTNVASQISAGCFPRNEEGNACSYCPFWEECKRDIKVYHPQSLGQIADREPETVDSAD